MHLLVIMNSKNVCSLNKRDVSDFCPLNIPTQKIGIRVGEMVSKQIRKATILQCFSDHNVSILAPQREPEQEQLRIETYLRMVLVLTPA